MGSSSQLRVNLTILFYGDWHVGEGAGQPHHIDRLVRRHPQDELPYVPAKTIIGIWRDACEAVAAGLDQGKTIPATWSDWVRVLFGDQPALEEQDKHYERPIQTARLSVRAGRFPERFVQHLKTKPSLRQAIAFIKPGIKIDRETGQARDDFLRFEEVVRGGTILAADVSLDTDGLSLDQIKGSFRIECG